MGLRSFRVGCLLLAPFLASAQEKGARAEYQEGVALLERGSSEATEHLRRAVELDPAFASAWKALGVAYAKSGNYEAAEPAFAEACKRNSHEVDACYFWARSLYALDRFSASLEALQQAERAEGRSGRIWEAMGQAEEALGRTEEAEKHYRQAVQLDRSRHALAYARFLIRGGRSGEAVSLLREAVAAVPQSGELHLELGRALLQSGQLKAAEEELKKALTVDPRSETAAILLKKAQSRLAADQPEHP